MRMQFAFMAVMVWACNTWAILSSTAQDIAPPADEETTDTLRVRPSRRPPMRAERPPMALSPPDAMQAVGRLAERLLSEIGLSLLSGNQAELLSGNKTRLLTDAELLSGNETKLLSENRATVLSGNQAHLLSGLKIEINIQNSGNGSAAPGAVGPGPVARFEELDQDGDGLLTAAEYAAGHRGRKLQRASRRFRRRDQDEDHKLTDQEFRGQAAAERSARKVQSEALDVGR